MKTIDNIEQSDLQENPWYISDGDIFQCRNFSITDRQNGQANKWWVDIVFQNGIIPQFVDLEETYSTQSVARYAMLIEEQSIPQPYPPAPPTDEEIPVNKMTLPEIVRVYPCPECKKLCANRETCCGWVRSRGDWRILGVYNG